MCVAAEILHQILQGKDSLDSMLTVNSRSRLIDDQNGYINSNNRKFTLKVPDIKDEKNTKNDKS